MKNMSTSKGIKNHKLLLLTGIAVFTVAIVISFTSNLEPTPVPDPHYKNKTRSKRFCSHSIRKEFQQIKHMKKLKLMLRR